MSKTLNKELDKAQEKQRNEPMVKKHLTKEEFAEFAKKFWEDLKKPQNFQG
ncbi:hypothetical protein [Burkholderia sp. LMG 13014]|uniref:hypothetical protein n=1 Tax=Burkholderia sp. LMG 13014 TaxID=2709306 RepID=UPI00196477DA|nr:hypothetical protein [Burkholderia sp. LMG 13014]